ncbi:MAG: L-aspartate oxidase [bacterium]
MHYSDITIIGSGVAGLYTALQLPETLSVTILTKAAVDDGSTRWAQGGIAVVLADEDTFESHVQDTLVAGDGLCDEEAVRVLVKTGPECVRDLITRGMQFDRDGETIARTREAAHALPRIIHAGGDATGKKLEEFLIDKVKQLANVTIIEYSSVAQITPISSNGFALRYFAQRDGVVKTLSTSAVVIATGGCGQAFLHTTNPATSTGNGVLLAKQLGLALKDLEFYQFHPTAFRPPIAETGDRDFLISESVRGEGGILRNKHGEAFMAQYDERKELAPRDIVTRAIWQEMKKDSSDHVLLDVTHLSSEHLLKRFPTIAATCMEHGIDIAKQPIPVSPSAHYQMGGIATDTCGKTSVDRIFAVGEVACTAVHGANRLASNSLLEGLVFAKRAAEAIRELTFERSMMWDEHPQVEAFAPVSAENEARLLSLRHQIKTLLWEQVGIVRTASGLETVMESFSTLSAKNKALLSLPHPLANDLLAILTCAEEMVKAAFGRKGSVGAHFVL